MWSAVFVVFLLGVLVEGCQHDTSVNIYRCELPLEIPAEGQEDWERAQILWHRTKLFHLKKDLYRRTPNLIEVIINSAASLEVGLFDGLNKMDQLVIDHSSLDELPLGILDNSPVRILQVFNSTRSIPVGFFSKMAGIRSAEIRKNNFREVKAGLFNGTPIYKLYLDRNGIETIENGSFYNMDNLLFLSLTGNKLTSFDSKSLLGEKNIVRALWLGKNQIHVITTDMFSSLTELQELSLELNNIHTIEDTPFQNLPELWYLDLSNNDLQELNPKLFPKEGTKTLRTLFIHNNKMTYINQALFIKASSLEGIAYGGNPLQCPCLDEVRYWTSKHNITRLCDNDYSSGERPTCVYSDSDLSRNRCIYDVEITEDVQQLYNQALQDYPKLDKKCDTTDGYAKATLRDSEF